jgi:hypothetical protein
MHRQLSVAHQIHQLLGPHCRFTMAINHAARTKMLAPDGPIDKTMSVGRDGAMALCAKGWKEWSFTQYDLRKDLRSRGVDDAALLPGYHYRDDAVKVWDVIAAFVSDVIQSFYRTDEDVVGDHELQAGRGNSPTRRSAIFVACGPRDHDRGPVGANRNDARLHCDRRTFGHQ